METITLNPLKIPVSRICLGTWAIGGWLWGGTDEQESIRTIHQALEKGINIIDTAPVYGFGLSEEIIGKALAQYGQRDKLVIATKVGLQWQDGQVSRNSSPARIQQELEDSLRRLRTDYVDLYQIHWPDLKTSLEESAQALLNLLEQGKIRAIGVSNFSVAQIEVFRKIAPIHTSQPAYNLFERAIEDELLPYTEKTSIVTLAYGSLCRGLLSGKMRLDSTFEGDDIRKHDPKFKPPRFKQYLAAVDKLQQFAQENYGKSVLALAIRWVLDQGHTIALWGARHPGQLANVEEVNGWSLDTDAKREINLILEETIQDPIGAEFMSPP